MHTSLNIKWRIIILQRTLTFTHSRTYTHTISLPHTRARRCVFVCVYVDVVMHVCRFKRVCMCACVRAYNERKLNPGSPDPKNSKHKISSYAWHRRNPRHGFLCRAGSLTRNSPNVSCEKECSCARDEGIYEWVRVERLFVLNSRHIIFSENTKTQSLWSGGTITWRSRLHYYWRIVSFPQQQIHRNPFPCAALVSKNRLLGLANFLGGKMDPFS